MQTQTNQISAPLGHMEIILGFEPGKDRLPLRPGQPIAIRQEAGDVVIDRGPDGILVLQGLGLIDLVAGLEPRGNA